MPDAETLKYVDWVLYLAILLMVIAVFARIAQAHAEYKQSLAVIERKAEQPDLMQVALANVAMRKMQVQLRELLMFGEPDDLKDLMAEYMRLKEAQQGEASAASA